MTTLYPARIGARQLGAKGLFGFLIAGALCLFIAANANAQLLSRLEHASNGTPEAPVSAVDWVTTSITAQRGHYVEGSSIPYRLVFETILPGPHRIVIAWDTKNNGRHATDYLTHFNRLTPHDQFGAHSVPETIQPLRNVSGGTDGPFTFPIPGPSLPASSFETLPISQRFFHVYNGTITNAVYVTEGTLTNAAAESRMAIEFVARQAPVVILFGGHLAAKTEWGAGKTAGGVSGTGYRMRLVEIDGAPAFQSVAVSALAVVSAPTCNISGPDPVCPDTTNTFAATTDAGAPGFSWTLTENSSGAAIVGSSTSQVVQVRSGTGGGAYELQVTITQSNLHTSCSERVTVLTNLTTTPLANTSVCPGGAAVFGTQPAGTGPFSFLWRRGEQILEGQTNRQLILPEIGVDDAGLYCVEVTGPCNTVTSCATLNVLSNTTATPLASLTRCVGEGALFSTIPSGAGPFTYRWRKQGEEIPGQTNRIYAIPSVTAADAGTYSVEVTGLCNPVTNSATLTVFSLPLCGIQGPNTVCHNSTANGFLAPPGMAAYRWRVTGNGSIVGATNEQAVVVTASNAGFLTINLTVVNSNGCSRSCSRTITVGDIHPPIILCPDDIVTNTAPDQCSNGVQFEVTATDNCNGARIVCSPPSGAQFPKGTTTVNCNASDGAGNQAGCSFNVTVLDFEKPRLSWPTNLVVNAQPGLCESPVSYEVAVADNCPGTSLICSPPSGAVFPLGTSSVNCRGSDAAGNIEFCAFDVTVIDNEGPLIACPGNMRFPADPGQCDLMVEFDVQAIDNCAMAEVYCVPPSGSLFSQGITTVVCVATDANDNQSRCSFEVQVDDNENPRLVCPGDISVPAEPGLCDALVNYTYKASDNCGDLTVVCEPPSGARFPIGQANVTCTAKDGSGNTVSCAFKVTVSDLQRPALTCPGDMVINMETGRCDALVQYSPQFADNCSGARLVCIPPPGSLFSPGLTIVNCSAVDASSNAVSCAFNVIVQDTQPPQVTCPANISTNATPGQCVAFVPYTISVTDNCPGAEIYCSPQSGEPFPLGETVVFCVAVDSSGNAQECGFSVTVTDIEPPAISCPSDLRLQTRLGRCDAIAQFAVTATDNCAAPSVTCTPPSGSLFSKGTNIVNCRAIDESGNSSACGFRVIVEDTEPPSIACPTDILSATAPGTCDARVEFAPSFADNCGGATLLCSPPSGTRFSTGQTPVNCVATDASGNEQSCSFVVTVNDSEPPSIACPTDQIVLADSDRCDAPVTFAPSFTDNCPGPMLVCSPPSGARFQVGSTRVDCVATDAAGNSTQCAFQVTVLDLQQPGIICPPDITTVVAPGTCDTEVTFNATASDNCSGVSLDCIPPSGSRFAAGATIVACTATDASSNAAACAFTVRVNDNEPPVVTCPANLVTNTTPGRCDAVVSYANGVTDNCTGATVTCAPPSGSTFSLGSTTVTCVASDAHGNTNRCAFTVTVHDLEKPAPNCPSAQELFIAAGECDAVATFIVPATDNCDGVAVDCAPPSGSRFIAGVSTVTCTATDGSGNAETCSFNVIVRDVEPPLLTCPTNMIIPAEPGRCDAIGVFTPAILDVCPGTTIACVPPSGARFAQGSTIVNCTATDASTNSVSCRFTVQVQDAQTPRLACPATILTNTAAGHCNAVVEFALNTSDNCPGFEVFCDPPSGTTFPLGTNTVVCVVTDAAGNQEACAFAVVVLDSEKPIINCPANLALTTESGRCDAIVTFSASATDNCSEVALSCEPSSGSRFVKGSTRVVCTATDFSGNTQTCAFNVVVSDDEPPVVTCSPDLTLNTEPGMCSAVGTFAAEVNDNCPGATVACLPPSGSEFPIGATTVVCQGSDAAGNARLCAFDVRVVDAEPPRLTCPGDLTVNTEPTQCTATVLYSVSGEDACTLTNMVCTPPSGSLFVRGITVVQCSARDGSGNEAACAFNVTVRDTEAPALLCPTNIVMAAEFGRCDATVHFTPSAADNCNGATLVCVPPSGSTFTLGDTPVNCTASDAFGNTNRCSFTVRVTDTQRPVVTCPANVIASCESNRCDAVVNFPLSVTDNCGAMSMSCNPSSGSRFSLGSTPVTCSAIDASFNVGTCSFTVTVRDNQPPVIQCPGDIIAPAGAGRCDAPVTFAFSAIDNCGGAAASCFPPSGSFFPIGATTVNCSATDSYSNQGSCEFTVTVRDVEAPTLQCPADILVNTATGRCDTVVNFSPQVSDNCAGLTVSCDPPSGTAFMKGTNFVTCTARDLSSNSISCTFRVLVRDLEKPQITCPGDMIVSSSANDCRNRVTFSATATDNCNGATIACTPPSNSYFNKGITTVICVATDTSGNTNRCSFSVTVNDTTAPTITCPANISTNATQGQTSALVHFAPSIADNCLGVSYVCTPQSGSLFPRGTTTVNCTATDASGNTRACSFMVSVNDNEPPVINCPTNLTFATTLGRCDAVANYSVSATDNSQMVTVVCTPPNGSILPKGVTEVLCTATDNASNRVSCGFRVSVVDLELPAITCPTNMIIGTDRSRCDARLTYTTNVTDNCGAASLTCNPPSGAILPKGTNTVTCTAWDPSGNTNTCAFTVRVVDYERPLIGCPANLLFTLPPGQCELTVNFNASVADNCPGATISCAPPSGSSFAKGITMVNCTARDAATNTSTCSFLVDVRDNERPVINCPGDINLTSYPGSCGAPVTYFMTVQDNCPGASVLCNPPSGSTFPIGTNWVTCNATDTSMNTASCTFRVSVRDVERPNLTCPADIVIDGRDGNCTPVATYSPTVRENCTNVTVTCVPPSGSTFPQGTNRVQCTALDASGNMNGCGFNVIVRLQPLTATPLAAQIRCVGETTTFTTTANGSGALGFTWLKDGVVLQGQTNTSLLLGNVTLADAGTYSVEVQGRCNNITNSATLQVNALVTITGMTNVTRCDCDPLILSPVVTGTGPFTYLWRKNGSIIAGATSNTLAFSKLSTNDTAVYTLEASGACNTAIASAAITVISVPNPAIYTNSGAIAIHDLAPAFPYPSSVRVTCVPRPVQRATVTLRGFSHGYPDDVDVLLTAPDGKCVLLMSDTGDGSFANNINITLDDSARSPLPDASQLITGTYRPANYDAESDIFPSPAPNVAPATTLSALAGAAPNGFWSLFVVDDFQLDQGSINNGWILRLYWETVPARLTAPRMLPDGSFQLTIMGDAGSTHLIEASSDLRTWSPIATVTLTSPETTFTDPTSTPARFYRCRQP